MFWTDPDDGLSSGVYRITRIVSATGAVEGLHGDSIVALRSDSGSEVESFPSELDRVGVEELAA